jgi:hypothetical protein
MTEFVPGDQYRIDVIGSDDSVLVDSWNNFIKGSVVKTDGTVMVDTATGTVYATLVGSITDSGGTVVIDIDTKNIYGNFIGDLYGEVTGGVVGPVTGNVLGNVTGDLTGNVTGDLTGDLYGDSWGTHRGPLVGNVSGNVTGELTGDVTGDLYGDSNGTHRGPVIGDTTGIHNGNVIGDVTGDVTGSLTGNVTGDLSGNVTGDVRGDVIATDGTLVVDTDSKVVRADHIHGTFYGDLIGNVTADSVIYGTFNGEMTGTSYGEFFGDMTGNITGDLLGDVTGNLTGGVFGSVTGHLLGTRPGQDVATQLNSFDSHHLQWNWVGGVSHPNGTDGPMLIVGNDITEAHTKIGITHTSKRTSEDHLIKVVELNNDENNTYAAHFRGQMIGPVAVEQDGVIKDVLSVSNNSTLINAINGRIVISQGVENVIELNANTILKQMAYDDDDCEPIDLIRVSKLDANDEKLPLANDDVIHLTIVEAYNGSGFVKAGSSGFIVDESANFTPSSSAAPTNYIISLGDDTPPDEDKSTNLIFNHKGVLEVPVLKARPLESSDKNDISAEEGMIIFNTSTKKFQGYTGSSWVDLH